MPTTIHDLADALIRMFGRDAPRQARENAASNAKAGDEASAQMWLAVGEIVSARLNRSGAAPPPQT